MKHLQALLLLVCIGVLIGCSASLSKEYTFEAGIRMPEVIPLHQSFEVPGYLKNVSEVTADIMHGSDLFTYQIKDSHGNSLSPTNDNLLYRHDIGYMAAILPDEEYLNNGEEHRSDELYTYTITSPGHYTIQVTASFMMDNDTRVVESDVVEFTVQ